MNALAALATNLVTAFPVTAANCNEQPFFDVQINNGAYVELTAGNQAARDMIDGRKSIEDRAYDMRIRRLLESDAMFIDMDGEALTGADIQAELSEMAANAF